MRRGGIVVTAGVLAALLSGQRSTGQAPSTHGTPAGCTYATCALRVEPAFFGTHLVRGTGGERVGRLGGFGGGVESLLTGQTLPQHTDSDTYELLAVPQPWDWLGHSRTPLCWCVQTTCRVVKSEMLTC